MRFSCVSYKNRLSVCWCNLCITYLFSFDRQEYSERLFYSLFFTSSLALPLMAILCRHISNLCESQCQFNNFCHFGHQPIIQNQWPNWFVYLRGCMIFSWFKNDRGSFLCIKIYQSFLIVSKFSTECNIQSVAIAWYMLLLI